MDIHPLLLSLSEGVREQLHFRFVATQHPEPGTVSRELQVKML